MARHAWQIPSHARKPQHLQVVHLQVVHRMAFEPLNATPMEIAKLRVSKLAPAESAAMYIPVREAFQAFRSGHGSNFHLRKLIDAINVGAELAASHQIASDHTGTFEAAHAALVSVMQRRAEGGSWTLRGPEIAALDLAYQVHRAQLLHVSRGDLGKAVTTVIARLKAALRGDHAPGTTVIDATSLPGQPTTTAANA